MISREVASQSILLHRGQVGPPLHPPLDCCTTILPYQKVRHTYSYCIYLYHIYTVFNQLKIFRVNAFFTLNCLTFFSVACFLDSKWRFPGSSVKTRLNMWKGTSMEESEVEFLNFKGAQELIPRSHFRQPMKTGGPVLKPYSYSFPSPMDCLKIPALENNPLWSLHALLRNRLMGGGGYNPGITPPPPKYCIHTH